jgi:hypothetical protein
MPKIFVFLRQPTSLRRHERVSSNERSSPKKKRNAKLKRRRRK